VASANGRSNNASVLRGDGRLDLALIDEQADEVLLMTGT
jgi:hypothetical protein